MENNEQKSPEELSLHELLQRIYNGTFDPKNIPTPIRQALVQVLLLRGQEHIAIARILKVSDRTIRRDIKAIWDQNSLTGDPEFTKRFLGEVHVRAMSFVETLTRMGHSTDESIKARSQAMFLAWRSLSGLLEKLHKLGLLQTDKSKKADSVKEHQVETSNLTKVKLTQDEVKQLKKVKTLPPMEREKIRGELVKEMVRLSKVDSAGTSGNPSGKDDEDPGTAGVLAAT